MLLLVGIGGDDGIGVGGKIFDLVVVMGERGGGEKRKRLKDSFWILS